MKKSLLLLAAGLLFLSCSSEYSNQPESENLSARNKELEKEVAKMKDEIAKLEKEIENYRNTPDKLYAKAVEAAGRKEIATLKSICESLEKYHPASAECKNAKLALQKLIDEQNALIEAEKAKRMKAVSKLKKKYDDISGITWYYNPYFTHYDNTNKASLYIGQKDNQTWLRLKMSYNGDDWIFFENAYLSYDGETKEINFNRYRNKESDNSGGYVWEWIDVGVDEQLLAYLKKMVNGKSIKMRLSGKYTHTRNITGNEKKALEDVLLAYDVLTSQQGK